MEGRDWVEVVAAGECPDCHFDATALRRDELAAQVRGEAARWRAVLEKYGDDEPALRNRPMIMSWSVLEYACHVRDLLDVMAHRLRMMLVQRDPTFGWWDHEEAAEEQRYNLQDPWQVAIDLETHARNLAAGIAGVADDAWERGATRGDGARFTVESLVHFTLHECHHHRWDAQRAAAAR